MKHSTKLLAIAASIAGTVGLAAAGWAYWTSSGSGAAAATVGTLNKPSIVSATPHAGAGTVHLIWTAPTTPDSGPLTGYYVERISGSTPSTACGSSPTHLAGTATSCDDTVAVGTYSYTVTAYWRSWTSTSTAAAVTIDKANTTTAVVSTTGTPSVVGQQVTYTATVSVTAPGSGTPTGNIEFFDGGTAISVCGDTTGNPLSGTSATCAVTYPASGSHTITAKYLGAANYNASGTSPSITQVVGPASTTTSLSLAQTSVVYGNETTETFTATVTPQFSGSPGGTVTIMNGATTLCTLTLPGTCSLTSTQLGASGTAYSVTATYNGDANFSASTPSPAKTFTVTKATPTISWTAPGSITYGTALSGTQLNATSGGVTGGFVYSPASGTVLNAGAGQALGVTFTPTDAADYNGATGATTLTVNKASQTISFTGPGTGTVGNPATLSATGGASGNPVAFTIDGTSGAGVCTVSGSNGTTLNYAAAGNCVIDANQALSTNYNAATQVQQSVTVTGGLTISTVVRSGGQKKVAFTGTGASATTTITVTICAVNSFPCASPVATSTATVPAAGNWTSGQDTNNLNDNTSYFARAVQGAATSSVFSFTVTGL